MLLYLTTLNNCILNQGMINKMQKCFVNNMKYHVHSTKPEF